MYCGTIQNPSQKRNLLLDWVLQSLPIHDQRITTKQRLHALWPFYQEAYRVSFNSHSRITTMRPYRFTSQEDPANSILELDPHAEIVRIFSSNGSLLGTLSWGTLIHAIVDTSPPPATAKSRKMTRAPLALKVQYRNPVEKEAQGMTGGVSAGGLFIETDSPYPVNTDLTVTFALPTQPNSPISATAKVSWIRGMTERLMLMPGMGIEFIEIEEKTRFALTQLINKKIGW